MYFISGLKLFVLSIINKTQRTFFQLIKVDAFKTLTNLHYRKQNRNKTRVITVDAWVLELTQPRLVV
jgi:hypothetical protein